MGSETRQNRSLRTKATRTLILSILLAASLGAATEMKMTVDQLRAFIESSVKKHSPDKQVADYLRQHVKLTNKLPQDTTIHWHGVRVPNAMDGVPHATQPPVHPGESFVYEFTPKEAGTFWFHPHITVWPHARDAGPQ